MPTDDPSAITAIAALGEPQRFAVYEWVVAQPGPVGRDATAAGLGITRALAAFHLDRLAAAGLLAVEFRRLSGRTGPGAGRPAKLYHRAPGEVAVSLPARRYVDAARILLEATERAGTLPKDALEAAAREAGRPVGSDARRSVGGRPGRRHRRMALLDALRAQGYEPRDPGDGPITLGNCPYHALVEGHRDLVCGMNLAWAVGVLEGMGEDPAAAHLDPAEGRCCVVIDPAARRGPTRD